MFWSGSHRVLISSQNHGFAVDVESLDGRIEVDQAGGDAANGNNRQSGLFALPTNQLAFSNIDIQRIGEDVD